MLRMEIHPGEGGADATAFAHELATAITKHTGTPVRHDGGAFHLHRL
jgi:protein subunit release factor A